MKWVKVEAHIYRCDVTHWQTWDEFLATLHMYTEHQNADETPVHLIYVFGNVNVPQPWALPNLHTAMTTPKHPQQITVMVNAPRILKVFMRMAQQVYEVWQRDDEYVFTDTFEEAQAILKQRHSSV